MVTWIEYDVDFDTYNVNMQYPLPQEICASESFMSFLYVDINLHVHFTFTFKIYYILLY